MYECLLCAYNHLSVGMNAFFIISSQLHLCVLVSICNSFSFFLNMNSEEVKLLRNIYISSLPCCSEYRYVYSTFFNTLNAFGGEINVSGPSYFCVIITD